MDDASKPVATTNAEPVAPVGGEVTAPTPAPATTDSTSQNNALPAEPTPTTPPAGQTPVKPKKNTMAVVLAIVIAIVLAAVAVYAYMKLNKKKTTTNSTASTSQTTATAATTVKAADIAQTSKDLDTSLAKVDDTKDFSSADLSDSALGL